MPEDIQAQDGAPLPPTQPPPTLAPTATPVEVDPLTPFPGITPEPPPPAVPVTAPVPAIGFIPEPVAVTYTRRARVTRIIADNTDPAQPWVIFEREVVIEGSDGSRRTEPLPPLRIPFHPARLIYMRDLETLQPTGEIHPWAVPFACLYSAAIDEVERDIGAPSMADKPPFDPEG